MCFVKENYRMYSTKSPFFERADYTWSEDSIRFFNTPTAAVRRIFFYVQEAGYFRTLPPYFTERANLNSFLLIYTIAGKGKLHYQNKDYTLIPGSAMWINCMNHHYYECAAGQEWDFIWLHFNGTTSLGYYNEFIRNEFKILCNIDKEFMENTMRRILSLTQQKEVHSEIYVSSLITEILTHLLIANSTENLKRDYMPAYLKDILKTIDEHFREPLSLDFLSKEFGISKYHLAKEFKRYMGTPPNEYLILTRLTYAKELLKYSTKTVEEIAFSCGFHNVSHFINLFKKHEDYTPLQFRKTWGFDRWI